LRGGGNGVQNESAREKKGNIVGPQNSEEGIIRNERKKGELGSC